MIYDYGIPDFMPIRGLDDLREQLPSIFNNSLSDAQRLVAVINCVNRMGLIVGEIADNWNQVESWIKTNGMDETVEAILNGWVADGTMAKILDKTALKDINKKIDDLATKHDKDIADVKQYVKDMFDQANASIKNIKNDLQQQIIDGDNAVRRYVDSKINGDPKGFFDSLADLQNKYPNGAEGIYIVQDESGANWYYWSGTAWKKGGPYLQSNLTLVDKSIGDFNNYLKNNQLIDTVDPAIPFNSTNLSVAHFAGKKWLHVEGDSTTQYQGVVWYIDPAQSEFQYFSSTYKKLDFTIQSDNNALFYVQLQNFKEDGTRSGLTTLKRINLLAGKQTNVTVDFNIPNFSGENEHYHLVIAQEDASATAFNICEYTLRDSVNVLDTDSTILVDSRVKPTPNFSVRITDDQLFNGKFYHVKGLENTSNYKGITWTINNVPTSYAVNALVNFKGAIQSGSSQLFHFVYQTVNKNGSVAYTETIGTMFLKANRMTEFDFTFRPNNGDYTSARYIIYSDSASDVDFYVSSDTQVKRKFYAGSGNNLFNNYLYNYEPNYSTFVRPVNWLGTQWLKTTSDDSVTNWQGLRLLVDVSDKTYLKFDYDIDFDIYSDNATDYTVLMQYVGDDLKLISQDTIGTFSIDKGVIKHYHYQYTLKDIANAKLAYFIIYQKSGTNPSFVIKNATMLPTVQTDSKPDTNLDGNVLPTLDIQGDLTGMSKDVKKDVVVVIKNDNKTIKEYATCKWQGDSSLQYPKKSYRLTFYTDETRSDKKKIKILPLVEPVNAINVKANWLDWTNLNNLLISNYAADITMENSAGLEAEQVEANNQEQITGYSANLLLNGEYAGLYTISDKKSDHLFNADEDNVNHAVIEGSKWGDVVEFKADEAVYDENVDFSVEIPDALSDELKASFNSVLKLTNSGTDEEFTAGIQDVINLDSVVNWIVITTVFAMHDNSGKNICWQTRDGKKWSAVMYDHDLAYGLEWTGQTWSEADAWKLTDFMTRNKLVQRLINSGLITDKLVTAYNNFKLTHSKIKVINDYKAGMTRIGSLNYDAEFKTWPDKPGENLYTTKDLFNFINKRYDLCDTWFTKDYLDSLKTTG